MQSAPGRRDMRVYIQMLQSKCKETARSFYDQEDPFDGVERAQKEIDWTQFVLS